MTGTENLTSQSFHDFLTSKSSSKMIFTATVLTTCVKLLLIPAYRSTDFEVHRNWLAITHSLPVNKWYFEETSEWTLDYPPLFAYFEYLLSIFAGFFDSNMLIVQNLNYASDATVLYQRLSVIVTDLLYIFGVYKCSISLPKSWRTEVVLPILLITNCGLIMVDHIHFQYNGMLYGILLLSIAYMLQEKYLRAALCFTILINMKHIYIYLAPAYFIYLLRNYCFQESSLKMAQLYKVARRFFLLASIVISVFLVTFLPFYDHLGQVFSRMFPFKRGLCHAYWAPNFWALYNTLDKLLSFLLSSKKQTASMTGGLVQEFSHEVLPNIGPLTTILLTGLLMLPLMTKLWTLKNNTKAFLRCIVLCGLTSFVFGWHVHEKAILMAILPLTVLAVTERKDAEIFLLLSVTGHYSLFPLLFPFSLLLVKVLLLLLHSLYAFNSLYQVYRDESFKQTFLKLPLLTRLESLYILGFVAVFLYENVVHELLGLSKRLPYLPLLLISLYCSTGVCYCWCKYYVYFMRLKNANVKHKKTR